MTISEIESAIEDFANAALRAKKGGLDGVEIKCDQGYLIHQFLSPYYNRRTDEYGGRYENRVKFLFDTIRRIREVVGHNFVVGLRITGDAFTQGDLTLADAIKLVKDIERIVHIDYIHVNGATNSTYRGYWISHADSSIEPMNFAPLAKAIREVVSIPVIAASMISHPEEAEHLLESGFCDLVSMTRAHIADAEVVNKVINNKLEHIRPCIFCNQGCVGNHWNYSDVRCIHNAATGREKELGIGTILGAKKEKRITVVGGGIAGLEFARVAAMRGHSVDLFEQKKYLGGQLHLASQFPYRQGLLDIVHFLERQARHYNVQIHLGAKVEADDLLASRDDIDVVVIATGATLYIPPIYENVDTNSILLLQDVFKQDKVSHNILIVDADWRRNALGIAEWLIQKGKKVTVISSDFLIGAGIDVVTRTSYYSRIYDKASFIPLASLEYLTDGVAGLRNVLSNKMFELAPIDQVIFISGVKPRDTIFFDIKDGLDNVYRVGDCVDGRGIPEAILAANRLAREL